MRKMKKEFAKTRGFLPVAAYSVIELLAVVAVLGVLAVLITPAFQGLSGSSNRRGAINLVMNTIDHARVAAIEKGRPTYVIFLRRAFPLQDGIAVVQEPLEPEVSASATSSGKSTSNTTLPMERLTPWLKLPANMMFPDKTGVFTQKPDKTILEKFPPAIGISVAYLKFGPSGTVDFPQEKQGRQIHLVQGTRSNDGKDIPAPNCLGTEIISVTRYTGRPQLDLSLDKPQQ